MRTSPDVMCCDSQVIIVWEFQVVFVFEISWDIANCCSSQFNMFLPMFKVLYLIPKIATSPARWFEVSKKQNILQGQVDEVWCAGGCLTLLYDFRECVSSEKFHDD